MTSRKQLIIGSVSMFVLGIVNGLREDGRTPREMIVQSVVTAAAFIVGYRLADSSGDASESTAVQTQAGTPPRETEEQEE